ncbi:MAG: glycosyltransferase family 4 protein [Chromatiaceae bacterium]|nr:glycosyltransferase family 4 protein [Chromatiaceae bacterium]
MNRISVGPSMSQTYLIILGHFGHMGGGERQAFHFIHYLRRELDASVAVLGWYGDGPLTVELHAMGCRTYNFPYQEKAKGTAKLRNLAHLAWFIRTRIRPDVILPFVSIHSKPVCLIWRWTGAGYCWWNQQDEGRGLYGTPTERRALRNAVHITSNSTVGADFLAETYKIPRATILVYNNGTPIVDPSSLKPLWRAELNLAPTVQLVSMLANITPFKDHVTLFHAWNKLQDLLIQRGQRPEQMPVLALAGGLNNSDHVGMLKTLAFDLGISAKSVRFLGAINTTNELVYESDLMVHSSVTEGCPNAVCEAMALGKTVVGTDIPGMRQALGEDIAKRCLAKPGDGDALAEKMFQFLTGPEDAGEIGLLNLKRIESEFTIEGMCRWFMSLIDGQAGRDRVVSSDRR